ncbi:helix-turn-helix domain-containing protein [Spongiibacter tropicus]|uniref:helix-turn-helix domain-containing protein n=1 Tax=Spongiibacter tropicus TaxID=454602 RepID=UPI0035BE40DE
MIDLPPARRQLTWNARQLMARRGLDRRDLRDALESVGITLSYSQVCRLVSDQPGRLSLQFLEGLITVLGCTPGELIREHSGPVTKPARPAPIDMQSPRFDFPDDEDTP